MIIFFLLIVTSIFMKRGQSQYSDLITQMDGVFTKLNSNETAKMVTNIADNIEDMLERATSKDSRELAHSIFLNMNEFFILMNNNETTDIIHNIRKLTRDSKVNIDMNTGKIMIYLEIILSLIIIILVFTFSLCVYKVFKKKKILVPSNLDYNQLID